MEYYSAIKENKIVSFAATWIQVETLMLSEISQKEKIESMHLWKVAGALHSPKGILL